MTWTASRSCRRSIARQDRSRLRVSPAGTEGAGGLRQPPARPAGPPVRHARGASAADRALATSSRSDKPLQDNLEQHGHEARFALASDYYDAGLHLQALPILEDLIQIYLRECTLCPGSGPMLPGIRCSSTQPGRCSAPVLAERGDQPGVHLLLGSVERAARRDRGGAASSAAGRSTRGKQSPSAAVAVDLRGPAAQSAAALGRGAGGVRSGPKSRSLAAGGPLGQGIDGGSARIVSRTPRAMPCRRSRCATTSMRRTTCWAWPWHVAASVPARSRRYGPL